MSRALNLVVRRTINASPQRLFEAWTQPEQLQGWWGPKSARCAKVELDLRVGGSYRITHEFDDGRTVWIEGEFHVINPPHKLMYTWRVRPSPVDPSDPEMVTVRFEPKGDGAEVIVVHERIQGEPIKETHAQGWDDCLDGLVAWLKSPARPSYSGG